MNGRSGAGESVAAVGSIGKARIADESGVAALDPQEYALFAQVARPREVEAGRHLFRRGDAGDAMFVVANGAVELDFGDDLVSKRLGERAFFGELGLLIGNHARSADARVLEDSALLELGRGEFETLATRDPHLLAQFLRRAIMRVVLNEQALIGRLRRRNQELQDTLDALRSTSHRLDQTEVLTRTDELTGLTNRRGLMQYLEQLREEGMLAGHALILLDCDRFKAINDAHGHLAGDRVLQGVANLLRAVAGKDDIACRLGGDEFCLLLQGQGREEARRIAGYIADSARMLERMHSNPPQMATLSIGACLVGPHEAPSWEQCYARVDRALYRAKRRGGGHVEWLD
ncbi:MAG: diguanylate cyclase domain-containing protein [Pseudomonadota bacterium]|uniref:GGDEF domain-containing protein n=1 Tax=Thermomonas sp. TaxID=1971895 RepID=UPI003BDF4985